MKSTNHVHVVLPIDQTFLQKKRATQIYFLSPISVKILINTGTGKNVANTHYCMTSFHDPYDSAAYTAIVILRPGLFIRMEGFKHK